VVPFIVEAHSEVFAVSLSCEAGEGRLIVLGPASGIPDLTVQAFHPAKDIFYRTPEVLTPDELAQEAAIHVPQSLNRIPQGRLVPSTLDGLVLMQHVIPAFPAISPLVALGEFLREEANVNFGILQADNGGLLFVHRAGVVIHAYASAHSLKSYLELPADARESIFPNIHAEELLITGSDLDHFEPDELGPIIKARRISIADVLPLCECTSEATSLIEPNPNLYALAIGAARVYAGIGGWIG